MSSYTHSEADQNFTDLQTGGARLPGKAENLLPSLMRATPAWAGGGGGFPVQGLCYLKDGSDSEHRISEPFNINPLLWSSIDGSSLHHRKSSETRKLALE